MAFTGKATYAAGSDLPELVEDVSDVIGIVSPHETPLLDHLGDAKRPAQSTVHEWIEDELVPNTASVDDAGVAGGATAFGVSDTAAFRAGDLVSVVGGSEVMLVTGVDAGASTVTVSRQYGGTSTTSLTDGASLQVFGNAALEGESAGPARFTSRSRRRNYTQIFSATLEVSGSMQASRAYGVADELDYQKQERMRELLRDLENTVINGIAPSASPEGSSTVRRSMNGILRSLSSNFFQPGSGPIPAGGGSGDELSEGVLNAALREIWERSSGTVDTIVCGGAQKRRINAFASESRAFLPEDSRYRDLVSVYESDFGVARVILSRWVAPDQVLLLDSSRIGVLPLQGRSFHFKPLAATGDSVSGQVIGEYTLELKNENAHGVLAGLAA